MLFFKNRQEHWILVRTLTLALAAQSLREAVAQQTTAAQAAEERWRVEHDVCADIEARLLRSEADAATAKQEQQVWLS